MEVELRAVTQEDVEVFFEHQLDPEARRVAVFPGAGRGDRAAAYAHVVESNVGSIRVLEKCGFTTIGGERHEEEGEEIVEALLELP